MKPVSASDLLKMVKRLVQTCEGLADQQAMPDDWWKKDVEAANKLIVKAEGETPSGG